ncbi:hypothetical protein ACQUJS_16280, partial [Ralstonia pseudosolanacearum]
MTRDLLMICSALSPPRRELEPGRYARAQIADKGLALGEAFVFNGGMLKRPTPAQHELEMVTLE